MRHQSHRRAAGSSSSVVATSVGTSTSVDSAANLRRSARQGRWSLSPHCGEHHLCQLGLGAHGCRALAGRTASLFLTHVLRQERG